ncbi:hypothetical protein AB205_0052340 [Aquarana catesbeiana]|uniref:Uncharacterized protein n=1 Tax=Aquarana catesbeiana TaxID=8400 RepID=A0A2G9RA65_AQUCT|nr:hypothetical protein AB205_0052340 [Aquarana catesbeiana]
MCGDAKQINEPHPHQIYTTSTPTLSKYISYTYPANQQHLLFAKEGPRHVHLDGDPDQHRNFRICKSVFLHMIFEGKLKGVP